MSAVPPASRRIELTLHKPWFALYAGFIVAVAVSA